MNQQHFIDYIKSPRDIEKADTTSLENLLHEYPWCQSAALLYTLKLSAENNIRFSGQLRLTTAYVTDRKILKKYLKSLGKTMAVESSHQEDIKIPSPQGIPLKDETSISDLLNALRNEVNTLLIGNRKQDEASAIKPLKEIVNKLEQIYEKDEKAGPVPELKPDIKDYDLDHLHELQEISPEQKSNDELIEQFIQNEPSISPPVKGEFFNPVDFAKHSLEDREDIVSETLARIYLKQGNTAKAIKIYKKLSLLNPEKSSFFAAQIEKIRKEQTN
jgi:tetratricopeptide (TPR) repeat protein